MLGAQSGVTDSNMIQYLGIIEQRTNELLAVQSYVNSKVTYSPILITLLLIMIYFRQKSGERQNVWFSFIIINYTINRNMFVTHINGVGKMSTTHKFVKVMFIFTCIELDNDLHFADVQDQDRYDAKQPVLLGAGPAPSQSQYPVIPPTIG